MNENVTDHNPVSVSEVIGTGRDAHRLVRANDATLTVWSEYGDNEPRMLDTDVAKRIGLKEPRSIRKLIERIWPEGQRPFLRDAVSRRNVRGGGVQEFKVSAYWLTEAQILKVCARSETPIADAILDDMIRVYMLARRGLLAPTPNLTVTQLRELAMGAAAEAVNPILERLTVVFDRMRVVEQAQVPRADTIFCGATEGARMRAGMRRVAHLRTIYLRPQTSLPEDEWKVRNVVWRRQWRRELGEIQREVQDATHHEGLGKSWDFLPIRDLTVAWETIRRLEAAAERDREKRAREAAGTDSQTVIEFDPKKTKREK